MNKKYLTLGACAVATPLIVVPTVLSCSPLNLEAQKEIGVNGLQVLDNALGALKLFNPNVTSLPRGYGNNSMEQYKFKLELIIPQTKQPLIVEFPFYNFVNFNQLAQLINTNYVNNANYKITFYKLQDSIWMKDDQLVTFENLVKWIKEDKYCDIVGTTTIQLSNFESNLTFANMKNLTTPNIETGIDWNTQYVGGIKPSETN